MPKRKLTKYEDDVRRGLRSPGNNPAAPSSNPRKNAENSPLQSPHDGIHTCSRGCSKPGCCRRFKDTIEEQNLQIEALKRDLIEKTAEARKLRFERVHDVAQLGDQSATIKMLVRAGDVMHKFVTNYIVENRISSAYLNKLDDGWVNAKNENAL